MLRTMFLCLLTFTLLYATLLYHRLRLETLRESVERLKAR
jgi:hypothetical protein